MRIMTLGKISQSQENWKEKSNEKLNIMFNNENIFKEIGDIFEF